MGGRAPLAADPNYRRVVHLTAALTERGYLVVGGGGLGIMEAANLGAYLADAPTLSATSAVDALAAAPPWTTTRPATWASRTTPGALRPGQREPGDPRVGDRRRADQPVRLAHREVLLEQHS